MDDRIESAIRDVLRPLLEADGGDVEFVAVEDAKVTLELSGKAAFSVGGRYIRTLVIEPLLRKVTGRSDLQVVLVDAVSRPRSQELDVGEVVSQIRRQEAQHSAASTPPPGNTEPDGGDDETARPDTASAPPGPTGSDDAS